MKVFACVVCLRVVFFGGFGQGGMACAGTVYYFDEVTYPGLIPDELLYTFQGVVNRNGPKIFIISDPDDGDWVTWTAQQFKDTFIEVTNPWQLLANPALNQYCHSFVLYNSAGCALAPNAAATEAALYPAACLVDNQDGGATLSTITAAPYSFTLLEDMSDYWTGTNASVLCEDWQRDNQLADNLLNQSWYCLMQGTLAGYPGTPKGLDFCLSERMMDFMVDKGNIWGLGNYTACEQIMLAHYPTLTTAFGWWVNNSTSSQQEDVTVAALSSYKQGFYGYGYNCSFFQWYGVPPGQTMTQYTHPLAVTNYSATNKYVVLSMSQGDNSDWLTKVDLGYVLSTSANPAHPGAPIYQRYPFAMFCDTAQVTKISPWPLWKLYQMTWGYDVRFMGKGYDYVKTPVLAATTGGLTDWDAATDAGMAAEGTTELVPIDYQNSIRNSTSKAPLAQISTGVPNARCLFFRDDAGFVPGLENDPPTLVGGKWVFADPVKSKNDTNGNFSASLTGDAIGNNPRSFFWVFFGAQPLTDLEATAD